METIRRQLAAQVTGATIARAEVFDPRFCAPAGPSEFAAGVEGRRIEEVDRRGKYLLLRLDGGAVLMMHLRMTGNILVGGGEKARLGGDRLYPAPEDERYMRVRFVLGDGRAIRFVDSRRFGHGTAFATSEEAAAHLDARLGPEPLSDAFTPEALAAAAAGRQAPLKSFLLDQAVVAGVGNIYADEALHRAALHPLSPAGSMRADHTERLRDAIRDALVMGLRLKGASIDDYRQTDGGKGSMQKEFLVHRREGLACPRCGERIRRIVVAGRSTYFCPSCQTRLRRRRAGR